jgi:ComF family protein
VQRRRKSRATPQAAWPLRMVKRALAQYIGSMLLALFQGLAARLPSRCAVCHAWPGQPLCEACIGLFAQPRPRCTRCALVVANAAEPCPACLAAANPLDAALAAVSYGYPWAGVVQEFKFREQPAWARSMALLMRSAPWVEPALDAADWVLPMPLSAQKLQSRGFNQAWLLAQALSPAKARAQWLLRIRDTPAQSSLARRERLSNVANAFAIDPLRQRDLEGKNVLLVDDVMTSGASLRAAAQPLRQAGVRHITALVFARAERTD